MCGSILHECLWTFGQDILPFCVPVCLLHVCVWLALSVYVRVVYMSARLLLFFVFVIACLCIWTGPESGGSLRVPTEGAQRPEQ